MSTLLRLLSLLPCALLACTDAITAVPPPPVHFTAPVAHCSGSGADALIEFASYSNTPNYQPSPGGCVSIVDAQGQLVAPLLAPTPYTTKQFTSPPLALIPGETYTVQIRFCSTGALIYGAPIAEFPYADATVTAPACNSARGMTWGEYPDADPSDGVANVGCQPLGSSCDAYHGDTPCTEALPLLCKTPLEWPPPETLLPPSVAYWSWNAVGTTEPVAPATAGLTSLAAANAYCADQFGAGWEVAEFHDGSGWKLFAYAIADLGLPGGRFWVDINDQPDATCW